MRVLTLFALTLATALTASANLITNGSFETGNFANCNNGSWCTVAAGSNWITGWTVGGVGVDWHNNAELASPFDGALQVDLNLNGAAGQTGTLSQSFATVAGANYVLSFYLAGPNPGLTNPRVVTVNIAGITQDFSVAASSNTAMIWGQQILGFTATGATTTLAFSSPNSTGYWGPVLDNVSVEGAAGAVPEPGSALLAGGALLSLLLLKRRR